MKQEKCPKCGYPLKISSVYSGPTTVHCCTNCTWYPELNKYIPLYRDNKLIKHD